ncbi:MAG: ABC transporter ATP-binding protein/permease [Defluviitaleaceae bacterium]|nr:ABC transporter ATP-binding protein/permease [Defluviitaleaceae bacterium]
MKKLFHHLNQSKFSKFLFILFLLLSALTTALRFVLPEVLRRMTNAVLYGDMGILVNSVIIAFIATLLWLLVSSISTYLHTYLSNKFEESLQALVLHKYINTKKAALDNFKLGDIVTHVIDNAAQAVSSILNYIDRNLTGYLLVTLSAIYMLFIEWQIAIGIIGFNILMRLLLFALGKRFGAINKKSVAVIKSNNAFIIDLLNNMLAIKVFNQGDYVSQKLNEKETQTLRINTVLNAWRNAINDGTWALTKLCEYIVVFGLGAYRVYHGYTEIGTLLAFVFVVDFMSTGLNYISYGFSSKIRAIANIESIDEILNLDNQENEPLKDMQPKGSIRFENVCFSYNNAENLLTDLSFTINEKDKVMVIGKNGTGKSTILGLMSGLYRPTRGRIYYGDEDITNINIKSMAQHYAYISQSSNIINGDAFANMALGAATDTEKLKDIIKLLNLQKAKDTPPDAMSQGEKQRLNISRSVYKSAKADIKYIFADEIFSNVDSDNKEIIASRLGEVFKDKTVVMVCHGHVAFPFNKILEITENGAEIYDYSHHIEKGSQS